MQNPFEVLKLTREEKNLTLNDVSSKLLIREKYLDAIESLNLKELPEAVYAIGFIKNYAKFLGLDPSEFISEYKNATKISDSEVNEEEFIENVPSYFELLKRFLDLHRSPIKRAIFISAILAAIYILIDVIYTFFVA